MLVVVSETVGPFDDVISARVFGLPDSEMCARAGQHSKDKATKKIHNFGVGNSAYSRIFAQESGQNKGVQAHIHTVWQANITFNEISPK